MGREQRDVARRRRRAGHRGKRSVYHGRVGVGHRGGAAEPEVFHRHAVLREGASLVGGYDLARVRVRVRVKVKVKVWVRVRIRVRVT